MSAVVLIDMGSLAHPIWHMSQSDPDANATSTKIVERVRALASGQPHVAVCYDTGRSFRHEISPEYKSQRPEHLATLQHQIDLALDTLRGDGFPCFGVKDYEADDVLASAATLALAHDPDISVLLVSSDKDLCACVNERVSVRSLTNGAVYDVEGVKAKFGVLPEQMVDFLSLTGDASDGVKGCVSVGPKRAAELLSKYGTIEDLYDALTNHGTQFTPALATALREFQPRLPTVRALLTLHSDVPLDIEALFKPRVPVDADEFVGDDIDFAMPTLSEAVDPLPVELGEKVKRDGEALRAAAYEASAASPMRPGVRPEPAQAPHDSTNGPATAPEAVPAPNAAPEAVLVPAGVPYESTLEPRTLDEAIKLAKFAFESRLFSAFGTAQAVLMVIMAGREYGMGMMASLRGFMIVEGRPTLAADLIRALVIRSGKVRYFRCVERTPERATFESQRGDDPPLRLTYTIEEARQAGLVKPKSGWERNPSDMLVARASSKLARLIAPDVIHGIYAPEELEQ